MSPQSSNLLNGKKILVTGAGTGIGRGVAIECARHGASVLLHYFIEEESVETAVHEIRRFGGTCQALRADFRELDEVKSLVDRAEVALGRIDVLVNNAGITTNIPFDAVSPEQFKTLFAVNVRAPYFLTQAVVRGMRARGEGGSIINLASLHAFGGFPEHSLYASTKGAIVSMTTQLAIELAPDSIRVNAIAPGWCYVESQRELLKDLDPVATGKGIPAGRLSEPADVGQMVVLLASDLARYLTGQTVKFDGGMSAMIANAKFGERPAAQFGRPYVPGL